MHFQVKVARWAFGDAFFTTAGDAKEGAFLDGFGYFDFDGFVLNVVAGAGASFAGMSVILAHTQASVAFD